MSASVLVLTLNEEINLAACLASLAWCDDIVVLDSLSTDRTCEIARKHHARVVQRPFDNWASHQNWAMANIEFKHPWVLYLDADERCDAQLRDEVLANAQEDSTFAAFRIRRKDFYLDRWLKHAQLYPTWLVRLFRPRLIRYERLVNPVALIDGPTGALKGHILHYPFSHGVAHWIARHNRYSDLEALEIVKTRKQTALRASALRSTDPNIRRRALKELFYRLPGRPLVKFCYYYLARRGFLDGRAGFRYAVLQAFYEYMISCKLDELERAARVPRVIFVNRFFHPDLSATSQMLSDLAFALARCGFDVAVITSRQTLENARAALPPHETVAGVRIERVWSATFGRARNSRRMLDYLTFHLSATWRAFRLARRGDVLVAKTDPPLISIPLSFVARWRRVALVNWLQDLFPEVLAAAVGHTPQLGWLVWLKRWRNRSLQAASVNIVLGRLMARRIAGEGVSDDTIRIIENWSDAERVHPVQRARNALRAEWQLGERFVVGYSGNLGVAHEFGTIIEAAARLKDRDDVAFLFIGGGAQLPKVADAVRERQLGNVHFRPYQSQERLAESLSVPDVHLVCLRPEMEGLIVPSKFYGVLAAGRPCVFIGDPDGEVARVLREIGCGAVVRADAPEELAAAIAAMASSPTRVAEMGRAARRAFEERFERQHAVDKWTELLSDLQERRLAGAR